ncbi:hypothetical protein GCM10012275_42490 [Longimycelium tulufanense]|uniref:Uncharacterized protein n=1 Tax=Longimycelium tulufanense TaxID=907463 RepID=A0A8J3CAY2_9PSEU|nr:hypothetical protein [Longimycelium tulufanense]GGM67396.1 hypothetical protein GCM10012275_42490 [Longimycelium tulufanense]
MVSARVVWISLLVGVVLTGVSVLIGGIPAAPVCALLLGASIATPLVIAMLGAHLVHQEQAGGTAARVTPADRFGLAA